MCVCEVGIFSELVAAYLFQVALAPARFCFSPRSSGELFSLFPSSLRLGELINLSRCRVLMEETWRDIETRSARNGRGKKVRLPGGRGGMKHEDGAGGGGGTVRDGTARDTADKVGLVAEEEGGGGEVGQNVR